MEYQLKIDPIWKKKDIVGFDIGTDSLKVVQLERRGKLTKLVGYGKLEIPENYIIEGIVTEPEKLSELTKKFLASGVWGKITAKRVCTSLPESKVFTRTITLPHMTGNELADAVNWDASQTIPMAMTDLFLDWQVIGPSIDDPKNDEIIYAAAPKAIVNSYLQFFEQLGMEIDSVETSLTAIIRSVVSRKNKDALLLVDIGGKTTNLAILDHVIQVTGSTLVGGDHITKRISEAFGVDEKEAEKIKKKESADEKAKIREAVDAEVTDITREATKMINYYEDERKAKKLISKVVICGGSASLSAIVEIFKEKLGISAEIGNPWSNISVYPLKSVPKEDAPAFANAVGLALLGVSDDQA
jgi:type IV pilus assembly protein PilM